MTHAKPLDTFDEDRLGRESLADYLTTFIKTTLPAVNENSFVLALDSPWGTGKTSFIQMWRDKLDLSGELYNIITYNAWENDDCETALIPLICSFSQLEKDVEDEKHLLEVIKEVLKILLPRVGNLILKNRLGIDTLDLAEILKEVGDINTPNTIYENYKSTNAIKDKFRELIQECTDDNKKLIIFIDELDRCRPTFAIETLEAIKHFFDLKNVIFIISLDTKQLSKSIKTVYGDIESEGYLRRFFDYQIPLPKSSLKEFLLERLTDGCHSPVYQIELLEKMADILPLSLRDLNVICKAYLRFIDSNDDTSGNIGSKLKYVPGHVGKNICLFFIALKYSDTNLYLKLIKEGVKIKSIPNGESLIEYVFGISEDSEDSLYYSPSVAQRTLHDVYMKDRDNNRTLYNVLLQYMGLNKVKNNSTTVSEIMFNIIEYGRATI